MSRFILNETAYFGAGCRSVLAEEVAKRGFKKTLVVADAVLIKVGVVDKVINALNGAPYEIFSSVKANPTVQNVKDGVAAFKAAGADSIIAVGGGSVIDAAKAVGIIIANPEYADVVSLNGVAPTKNKSIPLIAMPTTAGTAAEVTINYVITDEARQFKMVCVDPNAIPVLAVVDAELMMSMPSALTAATGMDALTHAIEGYITRGAWTLSDMFELQAIKLIADNLREACKGKCIKAMENLALGQYIAGMGFSNVGLGAVHSMAHPLGGRFDVAHGVANALLLPTIMEFNMPACEEKYVQIASCFGAKTAKDAVLAVKQLAIDVGIPQKLSGLGIPADALESLAKDAFADICTGGNPRDITENDMLNLYKQVY
jgi:lactaldehyde reductase